MRLPAVLFMLAGQASTAPSTATLSRATTAVARPFAPASRILAAANAATALPIRRVQGMTLTIEDWDAPRVEGARWALSRAGHQAPQVLFRLSLWGEEVCHAVITGTQGFPSMYNACEVAYHPMHSRRTFVMSHIQTAEPFRRMGYATYLMDAIVAWLCSLYTKRDVEVMYLLDHSRLPAMYTTKGWQFHAPLSWYILTRPLWRMQGHAKRLDVHRARDVPSNDPFFTTSSMPVCSGDKVTVLL